MEDPRSAIGIHGSTKNQSTNLFLHKRTVEINVPVADDSLLVATALCTGTPAKDKQAGRSVLPACYSIYKSGKKYKWTNDQKCIYCRLHDLLFFLFFLRLKVKSQLMKLCLTYLARGLSHQTGCILNLRECNNITDRICLCHKHNKSVKAICKSCVWRNSIFEGIQKESELLMCSFFVKPSASNILS